MWGVGSGSGSPFTAFNFPSDFVSQTTGFMGDILYLRATSTYNQMDSATGAYGVNRQQTNGWFIEDQRNCLPAMIAGLIKNDSLAFNAGLQMIDYGFSRQSVLGGYTDSQDEFHGACIFVQAVARACLLTQQSGNSSLIALLGAKLEEYKQKLALSAQYLTSTFVWNLGKANNAPYSHRHYIVGSSVALIGKLLEDSTMQSLAESEIQEGLALQEPSGVNPEQGGHDSSYQMVGVYFAAQFASHFPDRPITTDIVNMINAATDWEKTRILATGQIDGTGNTRTGGQEQTISGSTKQINHREVIQTFAYLSSMFGDTSLEQIAAKIASFYYSSDSRVVDNLQQYL